MENNLYVGWCWGRGEGGEGGKQDKIKHFLKKEQAIKYDCLNSLIKCYNKTVSDTFSMY